jgi:hypothetical protein
LNRASCCGHKDIAQLLLDCGADVNLADVVSLLNYRCIFAVKDPVIVKCIRWCMLLLRAELLLAVLFIPQYL